MDTSKQSKSEKESLPAIPPYVAYATFQNALTMLADSGVPSPIDRSVLKQFSGVNQRLILVAFQYMGLIDENYHPTHKLKEYAAADIEGRKTLLANLLKERYPQQVTILKHATPNSLRDSFIMPGVEASVKNKCITFFLQVAKATGLEMSSHILKGTRTRGPKPGGVRKQRAKNNGSSQEQPVKIIIEKKTPEGMISVPIPVGTNKTWQVILDTKHTKEEVQKFIQVVQIILGN